MTLSHRTYNLDGTFLGEPTSGVMEYEQEHMEGPHMAKFVFKSGEQGVTDAGLKGWFNNKLMAQFETMFDGVVRWQGFVWEMELELNGEVRIKSMENMGNAVRCEYTDSSGDSIYTDWFTNDESIARYGTKEKIVASSSPYPAEAVERAEAEMMYSASPYTQAISSTDSEENVLRVTLVGRMVVANNVKLIPDELRYIEQIADSSDKLYEYSGDSPELFHGELISVGNEIRRIVLVVAASGGWLYVRDIQENNTATAAGVSSTIGAIDRIMELSKLRNRDDEFYRLTITNDGGVIYRKLEEVENYIRYAPPRGIETLSGESPTWDAKPGFIRYFDESSGVGLPDTWLNDAQLTYYERTEMKDGDDIATFHGRNLDATDIYNAVRANAGRLNSG